MVAGEDAFQNRVDLWLGIEAVGLKLGIEAVGLKKCGQPAQNNDQLLLLAHGQAGDLPIERMISQNLGIGRVPASIQASLRCGAAYWAGGCSICATISLKVFRLTSFTR